MTEAYRTFQNICILSYRRNNHISCEKLKVCVAPDDALTKFITLRSIHVAKMYDNNMMLLLLFFFKHCRRCAPPATIRTYNSRGQRIFNRWRLFSKRMHLLTHGTNLRVCFLSYKSSRVPAIFAINKKTLWRSTMLEEKSAKFSQFHENCLKINQARMVCQDQLSAQGREREREELEEAASWNVPKRRFCNFFELVQTSYLACKLATLDLGVFCPWQNMYIMRKIHLS